MKNKGTITAIGMLAIGLVAATAPHASYAGGWINDYVAGTTSQGPHSVNGSVRGFVTGGSYNVRFRHTDDAQPLLNIQAPHISGGCGGIDLFAGSLSYLNFDQIVQKFQNIIKAAPAAAFDLALNTLCTPCANTMKALNNVADAFNHMQIGDCAAAKAGIMSVVEFAKDDAPNKTLKEKLLSTDIGSGASSMYNNVVKQFESFGTTAGWFSNTGKTEDDFNGGCPQFIKDMMDTTNSANGKSLIETISTKMGMSDWAPYMIGQIGDIRVHGVNDMYKTDTVAACGENTPDVKLLSEGHFMVHTSTNPMGPCKASTDSAQNLYDGYLKKLEIIRDAIQKRETLADAVAESGVSGVSVADLENLMKTSPLAIPVLMRGAVAAGYSDTIMENAATFYAETFARNMIRDLVATIRQAAAYAQNNANASAGKNNNTPGATSYCVAGPFISGPVAKASEEMIMRANDLYAKISEDYEQQVADMLNSIKLVSEMAALDNQIKAYTAKAFNASVAARVAGRQ